MDWWEIERFGTHTGGAEFDARDLVCPYCTSKASFKREFRKSQEVSNNSGAGLSSDVWKCSNCANYVFVVWRPRQYDASTHHFLSAPNARPNPRNIATPKEWHWPTPVSGAYAQARKSIHTEAWDAAATMARKAIQAALRELGAEGRTIKEEIDDLKRKELLPPSVADWADHVRDIGAVGAHDERAPCTEAEAREVCDFAYYVGQYLFTLPKNIEKARAERAKR